MSKARLTKHALGDHLLFNRRRTVLLELTKISFRTFRQQRTNQWPRVSSLRRQRSNRQGRRLEPMIFMSLMVLFRISIAWWSFYSPLQVVDRKHRNSESINSLIEFIIRFISRKLRGLCRSITRQRSMLFGFPDSPWWSGSWLSFD